MTKATLDAEAILKRATPLTHQHAHEIQPFGHLVQMPIALSEQTCTESVANLNQLLADVIRRKELRVWFVAEHVVDAPLTQAV
jgi:starvation-inducible DNA-binding protein